MARQRTLTPAEEAVIVANWNLPKGQRPSQEALALEYGVAPVTIRRALAEAGLIELASYKTKRETALLAFLESQGLNDMDKLRKFINKARTGNRGK